MASDAATAESSPGPGAQGGARARRRFWAPEVVQTSAMDCGPAALKCLLEGFGVPVSYGRLREACQTSVDGTSIDTLEEVARLLGLEAEQIMLPVEHVLDPAGDALPAIAVVRQPSGMTHFVVLWRRVGPYVQVMDPGRGRRWVRAAELAGDLYRHTQVVAAADVEPFIVADGFTGVLRARLRRLVGGARADAQVAAAQVAAEMVPWRQVVRLDGAARAVESLIDAGVVRAGADADRVLVGLLRPTDDVRGESTAERHACVRPVPPGEPAGDDGVERVAFRGAVLIRVGGLSKGGDAGAGAPPLPVELAAALDEPSASLGRTLLSLWTTPARAGAVVLGAASLIAAVGAVAELVLARPLLQTSTPASHQTGTAAALTALGAVVAALLALELGLTLGTRALGRRLDVGLRQAFLRKLPRLGDRYFGSRPVSDMAERAHLLHRVRVFPVLAGQLGRAVAELGLMAAAIAWLHPRGAIIAAAVFAIACAIPVVAVPALAERDLRLRAHSGSLMRFYLDALLGLSAVRTHGAEHAVVREHDERLKEWRRAGDDVVATSLWVEAAVVGVTAVGAAVLVADSLGWGPAGAATPAHAGTTLLLLFLALGLPVQAARLIALGRLLPDQRNVALRLVEPLGAPEELASVGDDRTATASGPAGAATIVMEDLSVAAGGHEVLADVNLTIAAGTHVAIVGPSGAGKSTLVGLLLGFYAPATGTVRVDGVPWMPNGDSAAALRAGTVWVEPGVQVWNRSLAANVGYGSAAAGAPRDQQLRRALADAELTALVERLPGGVDTALGEGGALLSGGEGQRVRFARELVRVTSPRLVLLDEAFRGLDRTVRLRLLTLARQRWAAATLIAISHDIEHTVDFPRVLVVEGGRVVEDGAPQALAAQAGSRYRALLDAEARVRAQRWSPETWRRLFVDGGVVTNVGRGQKGAGA